MFLGIDCDQSQLYKLKFGKEVFPESNRYFLLESLTEGSAGSSTAFHIIKNRSTDMGPRFVVERFVLVATSEASEVNNLYLDLGCHFVCHHQI